MTRLIEVGGVDIEAIRDQFPLRDFIEAEVKLDRRGKGLCPFHAEKSPSFKVYEKDQRYHCFGCGAHGDLFDYAEKVHGWDIRQTAEQLGGGAVPTYTVDRIAEIRAKRLALEEADKKARQAVVEWSRRTWGEAFPSVPSDHPYVVGKGITPYGARLGDNNAILTPLIDASGAIQCVQAITPDGDKEFPYRGTVSGGFMVVGGKVKDATDPVILCEGYATGCSLHEATGRVVVVCYFGSNMVEVARIMAGLFPATAFVVAGDDDHGNKDNAGIKSAMAASEALGCDYVLPVRKEGSDATDFNDMAAEYGLTSVADLVVHGVVPENAEEPTPEPKRLVDATPFTLRDPGLIPKRRWLYGNHLLRKFVSVDAAAGALGKSSLKIVEALAMVTNKPLLGKTIHEGPLRVWLYNLEDPFEETERRIAAACIHYGITDADIGGRLFIDSGRDQPCVTAEETANGATIIRPIVDSIVASIKARQIDVKILDPFVSSHAVNENDNNKIDMVVKEWGRISEACNCSINLVHHVRKGNGDEVSAESVRGAKALLDGARSALVYNRMTKEEALQAGLQVDDRRFIFRTHNDKANLAPAEKADWYRMVNVDLPNGDKVGVATPWEWPDLFAGITNLSLLAVQKAVSEGEFRSDVRARNWVGNAVAEALDLDVSDPASRKQIGMFIATWVRNKAFKSVMRPDENRKPREYMEVGEWVIL